MGRTLIKGGTIVNTDGTLEADLIIEGEKIAGIVRDAQPRPDDEVIDAAGLLVLPGIIDAHTHIQLDTGLYKTADNWEIGTKAAAAGGVTTVLDFATQLPGQTVDEALDNRFKETEPAIIDYGLHCMITDLPYKKEVAMLGRLVERGVPSFKIYTTYHPNYYMDDATMVRLMDASYTVGGLIMVHAENDSIVTYRTGEFVDQGKTGWKYHGQARPSFAETEAIHRVIHLASQIGAHLYIVHCTPKNSIKIIQQAREHSKYRGHRRMSNRYGLQLFCETCPQYLLLDQSLYDGPQPEHYILQPPLRSKKMNHRQLWQWLQEGNPYDGINIISSDSCDYTIAQKTEHKEFTKTPGGLPGVETLLPLIYTYGVCNDDWYFDLPLLVSKLCANPAKIFGRYPQKGTLQPGSDADIVLYDPEPESTITHKNLHYVAGYSPYEGMRVKGRVVQTISRGTVVYRYGADNPFAEAKPGRGQFVPGAPFDSTIQL